MNRNRLMLMLAALAAVLVIGGGYFLGAQPLLARASADALTKQSVQGSNDVARLEIARLQEQAKSLPTMEATLAGLQSSVPSSPSTSAFLSEINDVASSAGVTVSTITVGDAQAYSSPDADGGTTSGTAQASSSSSATPSPSASASATATPVAPKTTTNAAITASNFSVIPVSISVDGSFNQALAFVKGAQAGGRLFLIDSITSSSSGSPSDSSTEPTWTYSGYIYVLQESAAGAATTATNG